MSELINGICYYCGGKGKRLREDLVDGNPIHAHDDCAEQQRRITARQVTDDTGEVLDKVLGHVCDD